MKRLSHVGADGRAQMVDVSAKPVVARMAVAFGTIQLKAATIALISDNKNPKGDVDMRNIFKGTRSWIRSAFTSRRVARASGRWAQRSR